MKLTQKQALGKTGIMVPPIIYGTSYLGNLYKALSYQEKLELIRQWFACTEKPVVIDTAGKYGAGLALEVIGKGLRDLDIEPRDIIISNKLGWYRIPLRSEESTFEPGAWKDLDHDAEPRFGYEGILECHEQGNKLLGETYPAQLLSVHDPDEYLVASETQQDRNQRKNEILEAYRALFELKKEGRITAVGIGSKDWQVIRELYESVRFDWVMLANSFTVYRHSAELMEFIDRLHRDGIGIINSAVFHGGFFTGGDLFDYQPVDPSTDYGRKLYHWREQFTSICDKHRVHPAEACMRFSISHPAIAAIALNTSRPEKMVRNNETLRQPIPGDFWDEMKTKGLINPDYSYL